VVVQVVKDITDVIVQMYEIFTDVVVVLWKRDAQVWQF
jgi:hypothetical protein